ncbi:hypothetical protein [Pseudooceanicola sp.]|uniref:hypothetical protein n=1 Tax=Pseudooceanicola sp. TaxID=1914328 RepID=UPI0035C74AD2
MKRIAALSLIAAMAATSVSADSAKTEPTVSTQAGLAGAGLTGGIVIGIAALAVIVAAADSSSGT